MQPLALLPSGYFSRLGSLLNFRVLFIRVLYHINYRDLERDPDLTTPQLQRQTLGPDP